MQPKGGTIRISDLDEKTAQKVREIWAKNHAAVLRRRGTGWNITEVDENNDDLSSYEGKKAIN